MESNYLKIEGIDEIVLGCLRRGIVLFSVAVLFFLVCGLLRADRAQHLSQPAPTMKEGGGYQPRAKGWSPPKKPSLRWLTEKKAK
jgi:hypothetical protein